MEQAAKDNIIVYYAAGKPLFVITGTESGQQPLDCKYLLNLLACIVMHADWQFCFSQGYFSTDYFLR